MREHDEIDELFKNGLENFRPDATHLHFAPIADVVASKTAVTAVKAGFWAKFGLPLILGTSAVTAATVTIVQITKEEVSLKTAINHIKPSATEWAEETKASVNVEQELYYESMSVDSASVAQFLQLNHESQAKTSDYPGLTTVEKVDHSVQYHGKSDVPETTTTALRMNTTPSVAQTGGTELLAGEHSGLNNPPKTVIARFIGSNIEGAEDLAGIPVYRKTGRRPATGYMEKHAPALNYLTDNRKKDSLLVNNAILEQDSAVSSAMLLIKRPEFVWPQRELSVRAGLAYVPLQQEIEVYSYQEDSLLQFYWGVYDMVKRPSNKNEFLLSLNYQQQLRNKLELGTGLSMSQGGWRAFDDFVTHYWVDNLDGTYTFYNDTATIGEWDVSYRALGVNLSLGYHFPLGEKLAFGINGGITGSQVFVETNYRDYSSGSISSAKNTRFALSLFALGELTYRVGPIGLSAGFNLNGRSDLSHVFHASGFYNNVSFGLHTGIHYYFPQRP